VVRTDRSVTAFFLYRIRHGGPGRAWIPWRGPLLVIANHAAWFDPLWLGKVIPRRLTPMMTSHFYDLPALYWLMRYVLRVIRVEEVHARREAPELDEAVKRLASGECVVIFPEGRLRREEDRMLAPFQRGVWYILQKSPDTPVVPCWIEGKLGKLFFLERWPTHEEQAIRLVPRHHHCCRVSTSAVR
jgi:1-acyl-sn-glycerol-3-phosphate acyltransferase